MRKVTRQSQAKANGVKVVSATMMAARDRVGETVTEWISMHPQFMLLDLVVTQASDLRFHCVSISLFYRERAERKTRAPRTKN
jgi:hypothetical protein